MLSVQKVSSIYKATSDLKGQKDSYLNLYDNKASHPLDQSKLAKEFKEILENEVKKTKPLH